MATIKYQCDKCGSRFTGDDYTQYCPKCASHEITSLGGVNPILTVIQYFKDNKTLGYLLVGIVLLIIILLWQYCNEERVDAKYVIDPVSKGDHIEVTIWRHFEKDGKKKKDTLTDLEDAILAFKFKDRKGNIIEFKDNKIFPCDSGDYLLEWIDTSTYPLLKPGDPKKRSLPITFANGQPNTRAGCNIALEILSARNNGNCQIVIKTTLDNVPGRTAMISIDGRAGTYKDQKVWAAREYSELNIWAYEEGVDPTLIPEVPCCTKSDGNGNPFDPICPMDATDINDKKAKFITAANAYGQKPNDDALIDAFCNIIGSNNPQIQLDGILLENGLSALLNKLRIAHDNPDEGKTFLVEPASVDMDPDNGAILAFNFITQ